jgi:ATP-dependent RNA helicase DDX55/SPB4
LPHERLSSLTLCQSKTQLEAQATPTTLDIEYTVCCTLVLLSAAHHCKICESDDKFGQLVAFLRSTQTKERSKFIVYFSTCACVSYFARLLAEFVKMDDFPILMLHSKLTTKVGCSS